MKILNNSLEKGFETNYSDFDTFVKDLHLVACGSKFKEGDFAYVLLDDSELPEFIKDVELNTHRMMGGRSVDPSRVMMYMAILENNVWFKLLNQAFNTFPSKDEFSEEYEKLIMNAKKDN